MDKRILLIDDNVELCQGLSELLRDEGYLVDCTSESAQGPEYIAGHRYDACIFDYKMKGLNGVDLLKIMKAKNPCCAVFIISGRTSIETFLQEERVADLVTAVFTKPFNIDALLRNIRASIIGPVTGA